MTMKPKNTIKKLISIRKLILKLLKL